MKYLYDVFTTWYQIQNSKKMIWDKAPRNDPLVIRTDLFELTATAQNVSKAFHHDWLLYIHDSYR